MVYEIDSSSEGSSHHDDDSSFSDDDRHHPASSSVMTSSSFDDDETDSSPIDRTTTNTSETNNAVENETKAMKKYAAKENTRVDCWRWVVILSILSVGAIVCAITYITLSGAQTSDSETAVRISFVYYVNLPFLHLF